MLYSTDYGFSFVHIPKCAGTSLRRELSEAASFPQIAVEEDGRVASIERLPGPHDHRVRHELLGRIHLDHLPLTVLKAEFPATFRLMFSVPSFAICRDPRDRFISGVRQRLREFKDIGATEITEDLIRVEAEEVCNYLDTNATGYALDYIHFTPQSDFVVLEGEQIVRHVFALHQLQQVRDWLETEFGAPLQDAEKANQSVQPKGWYKNIHGWAHPLYQRLIPKSVRKAVFPILRNSAMFAPADGGTIDLGSDTEVFIARYYEKDTALYQAACTMD